MPEITINGKKYQIDIKPDSENNPTTISFYNVDNSDSYQLEYPYSAETDETALADLEKYSIHLLKHRAGANRQSDIFKIMYKNSSNYLGYIIPINIFADSRVDILNNVFADKQAKFILNNLLPIVFYWLILRKRDVNISGEKLQQLTITDFYDENTIIFIVKNEAVNRLTIDIDHLYPDLLSYGYVSFADEIDEIPNNAVSEEYETKLTGKAKFSKIALSPISIRLAQEPYLQDLFKQTLKMKLPQLMRFHLLYQVVELLINKIGLEFLSAQPAKILAAATAKKQEFDTLSLPKSFSDLKNILEENIYATGFNKSNLFDFNEQDRINKIFSDKAPISQTDYETLKLIAPQIHKLTNITLLSEHIYKVRNMLVHGYHSIQHQQDVDDTLRRFNWEFEKLIVDIVIKYR